MTDEELIDAARKALEGTTQGPWELHGNQTVGVGQRTICKTTWQNGKNDARFIVAAHELVPRMVVRIQMLVKERDARIDPRNAQEMILNAEPIIAEMALAESIRADEAEVKLAKAVGALQEIAKGATPIANATVMRLVNKARAALAELEKK